MDERQRNNVNSAMAKVLVLMYIAIVVFGVIKFFQNFNIMDCIFTLVVVIAVPLLVLIFLRNKKRKVNFPMTLAGVEVFPDRTKKAKIGRIKAYLLDSLSFSIIFAVIQIVIDLFERYQAKTLSLLNFDEIVNYSAGIAGSFFLFFAVYFIADYVIYEGKSKCYCKQNSDIN